MESMHCSCSICFYSYDENKKRPLVLPCSHSFCQECLENMEDNGNKLCPFCKANWEEIEMGDLTLCYQLIPGKNFVISPLDIMEICEHHNIGMTVWCESCHCSLCIKCIPIHHKECDLHLIKDKRHNLKRKYTETVQELENKKFSSENILAKQKEEVSLINTIEADLSKLKENLENYTKEYISWKSETNAELDTLARCDAPLTTDPGIIMYEQAINKKEMPKYPETFLMSIAKAYAASKNGTADTFISIFQETMKTNPELMDGQMWTLVDSQSFATAEEILTKTSTRPNEVIIKASASRCTQALEGLLAVLSRVKCCVRLSLLNCFWTASDTSRTMTKKMIDLLLTQPAWCTLVQVWGHLDGDTAKMLSKTVQRIGLVLASESDMNSFSQLVRAIKPGTVSEIDLSVLQTFKPANWMKKCCKTASGQNYSNMEMLTHFGIVLALHFPNLQSSHFVWMFLIINKITEDLKYLSVVEKLYLPGTTLSPDAILGVLRDAGLKCEVHLPPDLTAEYDREEVEEQYEEHKCTIVWDAE